MSDPLPLTSQDVDTYGWDTVFALNFTHANAGIVAGWANVDADAKNVSQAASDDPSYKIDGVLGPWQLTEGGDGKNVRMNCPFVSGTYAAGTKSYPLDGANLQVVIEIGMEWVPDPGQFNFVVSDATVTPIAADLDKNQIDAALQGDFTAHGKTLSSAATATMILQGKEWVVTDGTVSYYLFLSTDKFHDSFLNVYQYEAAWKANLQALKQAVSADDPAVAIIQIVNNPTTGIAAAVLPELLSDWFNANIAQFNHVFSALDLSPLVAKQTNYTWMLPTATSYAVTDQGTLDSSIFGVLTMVENNTAGSNHQVSPYAIPAGADAGFMISGPNFMKYMMLAGAQEVFNSAPATSFTITNDGLTVQNNARILFGKFHMSDDPTGSIADSGFSALLDAGTLSQDLINALGAVRVYVQQGYSAEVTQAGSQWLLTQGSDETTEWIVNKNTTTGNLDAYEATSIWVDVGNFQMSLNHTWVQISFTDVTYPANSDYDTHVTYTENVPLLLKQAGGKNIFWMGDPVGRSMVVNVTETKAAITRELVEDGVFAVLSLIAIGGPLAEGLFAGAEVGEVAADGGNAVIDEEAMVQAEADNPQAAAENNADANNVAAEQTGGRWTNIKNAFKAPRWKFVGMLAGLAGAVRGVDQLVDEILKNAALNEWEKVPGFDDFAETAIQPYSFPAVSGFTLKSASLASSLQMGLTVNASAPAPVEPS